MTVHRPDEFFARLGRARPDRLRRGLPDRGLGRRRPRRLPDRAGRRPADAGPVRRCRRPAPSWWPGRLAHQRSTTTNSRTNIAHHYDLSNDLFATFLDETLSYSSALFDTPIRQHPDQVQGHLVAIPAGGEAATEPLAEAQVRKIERLLDRTGVGEGTRLLEIGTGWGELAVRAARRGAPVRSITLSSEQQAPGPARGSTPPASATGCSVDLCDYRAIEDHAAYDAVVSVEMIEAVGHDFWPAYFQILDRVLAPGGKVGLQAILMPHDRMLATRRTHTWINKYIFPGGFLPSAEAIDRVTREHTTLRVTERLSFGSHYAETLRRWDATFRAAHGRVRELGFDETFERMWHFYLEYSRAGFASGYLDVEQIVLERP